jgi:hypothetical protein
MAGTEDEEQRDHQSVAEFPRNDHENDRRGQEQQGNGMGFASDQRVQDVPAVELPDRNQIEGRDEDSDPAGKQPRVQYDVVTLRDGPKVEPRKPFEQ